MPLTLYPGKYRFVCSCPKGHLYEPFEIFHKTTDFEPYCWYCKGEGKVIRIMDKNEYLDFSYNWNNKLDCKSFSTIRLRNDKKYYAGAQLNVRLKGVDRGTATVVAVSHFTIDKINESIARLDTGYSAEECRGIIRRMYVNKPVDWASQQLCFCILTYDK